METTPTSSGAQPKWFYVEASQQIGPVSPEQLRDLAVQGRITRHTPVWREGSPDWVPAAQTGLARFFPETATPPVSSAQPFSETQSFPVAPLPSPYSETRAPRNPDAQATASVGCLPLLGMMILSSFVIYIVYALLGQTAGSLIWLASCFGVLYDAHKVDARAGVVKGLGGMGPWGWFFACLLLWIVGFPMYLLARPHFVRAQQLSQLSSLE